MGLFISKCSHCNKEIHWFLEAKDVICECGTLNTAKEIEESWHKRYKKHIKKLNNNSKKDNKD